MNIYKIKSKDFLLVCMVIITGFLSAQKTLPSYPKAKQLAQENTYFGKVIKDEYGWMENENDPELKNWIDQENVFTYNYIKEIPYRFNIQQRLTKNTLISYLSPKKYGKYFIVPHTDDENKCFDFYYTDDLTNVSWQELYVTKALKTKPEENLSLKKFAVSANSNYLAFSFNRNGSDWEEIKVVDLKTGKTLNDHLYNVKFSSITWKGSGFFYSRYDSINEERRYTEVAKFQHLYYHKLGDLQDKDSLVYKRNDAPLNYFYTNVSRDERFLIISDHDQANGLSNYLYYDYKETSLKGLKPLSRKTKFYLEFVDNHEDTLIFKNGIGSIGRIIGMDCKNPKKWVEMIPALSDAVFEDAEYYNGHFYVIATQQAEEKLIVFDTKGNIKKIVAFPFGTHYTFKGNDIDNNKIYFAYESCLHPPVLLSMDISSYKFDVVNQTKVNYEYQDYEIKKVWYKSDTTNVPMLIMSKKNMSRTSDHPLLLEFYGGFGKSFVPQFDPGKIMFIENGGIYAFAMIRGGGELGPKWHNAGSVLNKNNSVNDIINAAHFLIDKKYTNKNLLAISGGSQGGLMTAAAAIRQPDLFKVAIPVVGLHDMLKFEKYGAGPLFKSEYGTIEDSLQFLNLLSYSPLHNIKRDTNYPSMLILTSDHDDRVAPVHSYKLAATLQELNNKNVLLRVEKGAGHNGANTYDKSISEMVDFYSFLFYNLGIQKLSKS
ncbi:MAG TPA: prolyl oligopeptidase family serine peptidase [Bacteroidia bacterium]